MSQTTSPTHTPRFRRYYKTLSTRRLACGAGCTQHSTRKTRGARALVCKSIRRRVLTGLERLPIIRIIVDHLGKEGMAPHAELLHQERMTCDVHHTFTRCCAAEHPTLLSPPSLHRKHHLVIEQSDIRRCHHHVPLLRLATPRAWTGKRDFSHGCTTKPSKIYTRESSPGSTSLTIEERPEKLATQPRGCMSVPISGLADQSLPHL